MHKPLISLAALGAVTLLSACGGGGGGGGTISIQELAILEGSADRSNFESDLVVNTASDTLNYVGFVNIGPDTDPISDPVAYVGRLSLTVDFATDAVSGTASNFGDFLNFNLDGTLPSVPGSLALNGTLTGDNQSIGSGIDGTATGTVGGYDLDMTLEGNILGDDTRSGVALWFDGTGFEGGVGLAVR